MVQWGLRGSGDKLKIFVWQNSGPIGFQSAPVCRQYITLLNNTKTFAFSFFISKLMFNVQMIYIFILFFWFFFFFGFLLAVCVGVHFRVEFDCRFNHCHIAAVTNQSRRREVQCDIRDHNSSPPTKTSLADSQSPWYYAIIVHVGASSVEMKSSDDDKHCVGPRKPQIPTDSWK